MVNNLNFCILQNQNQIARQGSTNKNLGVTKIIIYTVKKYYFTHI